VCLTLPKSHNFINDTDTLDTFHKFKGEQLKESNISNHTDIDMFSQKASKVSSKELPKFSAEEVKLFV